MAYLNWGASDEEVGTTDLDDNKGETEADLNDCTEEETKNDASDELNEENSPSSNERRIMRPPTWMRNYKSGEDAVRSEKWRKVEKSDGFRDRSY
ncbi:unnamed protein product [Prunus armeniaca]